MIVEAPERVTTLASKHVRAQDATIPQIQNIWVREIVINYDFKHTLWTRRNRQP